MSKRKVILATVLLTAALWVSIALGQDPTTVPEQSFLQRLLGWLYNPVVLAVVGLAIQFVPGLRSLVSNHVAPIIQTVMAWLAGLTAPAAARAAGGPVAALLGLPEDQVAQASDTVLTAGFGGFLGGLAGAVLQAGQGYLLQRMFAWPGRTLPPLPKDSRGRY